VRFNFERGKSCRYSTYTYSKQLGEFLRVGEGGGMAHPAPPKSATACEPLDSNVRRPSCAAHPRGNQRYHCSICCTWWRESLLKNLVLQKTNYCRI